MAMHVPATRLLVFLAVLGIGAPALPDNDAPPPRTRAVQTITVSGTDLTGLNAGALTAVLTRAEQQGATVVVVDMGSVSHMTPAGMASLEAGAERFGRDSFGVANLSGQPAALAQSEGRDRFRIFASLDEARAALGN
jgi:anti-anti-sigma regulatory factor